MSRAFGRSTYRQQACYSHTQNIDSAAQSSCHRSQGTGKHLISSKRFSCIYPELQINRLLDYALNDQREDICYNVLYDLVLLGKNDIMFDETHIIRLLQMITTTKQRRIQQKAMQCAQTLIETHRKLIVRIMTNETTLATFVHHVEECERIMHRSIEQQHYTNMISSARLLYSILRIAFTQKVDGNAMDVDMPVLPTLKALGHRVAETITQVDLKLITQEKSITQSNRFRVRIGYLLKIHRR